jgi:hypothetical protein
VKTTIVVIDQPEHQERLRRALETITDSPHTWDQSEFCGTPCCLFGHLIIQTGLRTRPGSSVVFAADGAPVGDAWTVAENLVGLGVTQLSPDQRRMLEAIQADDFEGEAPWGADLTISELWEYAGLLTGGAIAVPEGIADFTHPVYAKIHGPVPS